MELKGLKKSEMTGLRLRSATLPAVHHNLMAEWESCKTLW